MARLQNEVCTKDFFEPQICHKKCSEIFPETFEPLCSGSKTIPQSRQIILQISLPKMKKILPTSFCRRAGRRIDNVSFCPQWYSDTALSCWARNARGAQQNHELVEVRSLQRGSWRLSCTIRAIRSASSTPTTAFAQPPFEYLQES